MNAEYHSVKGQDLERAILEVISAGPERPELQNFVPAGTEFEAVGETQEKLKLTLSQDFWDLQAGERYAAAAQITFTMAVLEEGKEIFLLDDLVPGAISDGDGKELSQPLSRDDFEDVRPWVEVQQPAAGAILGSGSVPVLAETRVRTTVAVVGPDGIGVDVRLRDGAAALRLPDVTGETGGETAQEGTVIFTAQDGDERHITEVPVILHLQP